MIREMVSSDLEVSLKQDISITPFFPGKKPLPRLVFTTKTILCFLLPAPVPKKYLKINTSPGSILEDDTITGLS